MMDEMTVPKISQFNFPSFSTMGHYLEGLKIILAHVMSLEGCFQDYSE